MNSYRVDCGNYIAYIEVYKNISKVKFVYRPTMDLAFIRIDNQFIARLLNNKDVGLVHFTAWLGQELPEDGYCFEGFNFAELEQLRIEIVQAFNNQFFTLNNLSEITLYLLDA